jgi:hypothetical protein
MYAFRLAIKRHDAPSSCRLMAHRNSHIAFNIYEQRWLIEDYHKAVKTGFRIEDNQLKQASSILALFGMIAVIATQLLAIREHCRLFPTTPVEEKIGVVHLYRQSFGQARGPRCCGQRRGNSVSYCRGAGCSRWVPRSRPKTDRKGEQRQKIHKSLITLVERHLRIKIKIVGEFWRALARMGGFIGRKSDGEPGWQTIWKGYKRLQDMLLGANLL